MKRFKLIWLALLMAALPAAADRKFIVKAPKSSAEAVASRHGLKVLRSENLGGSDLTLVSSSDSKTKEQVLIELQLEPEIEEAEADVTLAVPELDSYAPPPGPLESSLLNAVSVTFFGTPVRSAYVEQDAVTLLDLADAHNRYGTGRGTVAILDTGVDPNHPALSGVLVPGYDFTRDIAGDASEWPDLPASFGAAALTQSTVAILDTKTVPAVLGQSTVAILDTGTAAALAADPLPRSFGHGTMVAGLVHLVAPTAKIMPLKVFRADGTSNVYQIARAIHYAVDNGAKIINMSFSMPESSPAIAAAVKRARSKAVLLVSSVGNTGTQDVVYPASFTGVIGVGATDRYDLRCGFSNYGPSAKVAAPGEALITTYPANNYASVWGTSFSAALVSGSIAAMNDAKPGISYERVLKALDEGPRISQGMGRSRLDLYKALHDLLD